MPVETAKNIPLQGINQGIKITHCDTSAKSTKSYDEYKERNLNDAIRRDAIDSSGLAGNTTLDHELDQYVKNNSGSARTKMWIKRIILSLICTAIAAGFVVPIVIYYIEADRGTDNAAVTISLNIDNCPVIGNDSVKVGNTTNTSDNLQVIDNIIKL